MKLGIPVYEGVNLLDVAGPYEMFSWARESTDLQTVIVSWDGRPVTTVNGLRFEADASFSDVPALDVLWTPGGDPKAVTAIMSDLESPYLAYLRQVASGAQWVCSVCEGALLLARAGLLDGHRATTHWAAVECLKRFDGIEVDESRQRFVRSGNRLTGGGISSGLDEALELLTLLYGKAVAEGVQVTTQYFPKPPVDGTIPASPPCTLQW
jgi:transcriptional regulator GlxA family with amidase domain